VIRIVVHAVRALRARIVKLPLVALITLALLLAAGAVAGGVLLFRTYEYVQHDNEFCLSCHLMADPYERFARSAHRGLGCKACHQPTMVVRTRMALTQILEQPEELNTHAEVPNDACAECHVRGDPEKWRLVSASAGHRVHLESQRPELRGLQCVECHSSSVHEFSPTEKTCRQSGCHENTQVRLGRMGNLTIHCASCHEFNAPLPRGTPAETLAVALRPRQEECLSCHAMRMRVRMPEHDPHGGACGACHNPHEQTTPGQAVESCATVACHTRVDTVSAFHRGLDAGVLAQCTSCHGAHEFRAATECLSCHQDMTRVAQPIAVPRAGRPRADSLLFRHPQHSGVACTECHQTAASHGQITITAFPQCRQCHHSGQTAQACTRCHERSELRTAYQMAQPVRMSVAQPVTRRLPFDHGPHEREACTACHASGPEQSAAAVSCNACHEKHHVPETNCRSCHQLPPASAHTTRAHLGCGGAGCHTTVPFRGVPRTRQLCLGCHQQLADHMPRRNCIDCHALPQPRAGTAPATSAAALPHGASAPGPAALAQHAAIRNGRVP
jgi:hypothetical protein